MQNTRFIVACEHVPSAAASRTHRRADTIPAATSIIILAGGEKRRDGIRPSRIETAGIQARMKLSWRLVHE